LAAPAGDDPDGLLLWPLAVLADQGIRGGAGTEPLRLRARYLLTGGGSVQAATDLLDRVLVAIAAHQSYRLAFEPVPAELWQAASIAPRPVLLIDVPVQVRLTPAPVVRVRLPIVADLAPLHSLTGRVLGPGGVPLPDIAVGPEGGTPTTRTDSAGGFTLTGVPASTTALLLSGKGLHLRAELPPATGEPVVIHCELEED
jgi:hypothetical protein